MSPASYARCSASTEKPASTAGLRTCATRCRGRRPLVRAATAVFPREGKKRTCGAAADVGFRYRMAGLAEGVGDGGCTEVTELDPFRDPGYQRREPRVVRALQRLSRETPEHGRVADLRDAVLRTTSSRACGDCLTNGGKRTCRAAADFGFCYRTAFLGEGGGDEGCTEPSESGPGP